MAEDPTTEDVELDEWLSELAGNPTGKTTEATRLRQLILDEHARYEGEFDELRARRLRRRVLDGAGVGTSRRGGTLWRHAHPGALAASVLVVVAAGLLVSRIPFEQGPLDESGWVMSYGELHRTRGEVQVLRVDVDTPGEVARQAGIDLAAQAVVFEMTSDDTGRYRFEVYVPDVDAVRRFNLALEPLGLLAEATGFYVLTIS